MERLSRIRNKERKVIEDFLLLEDWCSRIQGVILMTANPRDALSREKGYLPVVSVSGSIMNEKVLESMASVLDDVYKRVGNHFSIYRINTSSTEHNSPEKSCAAAASKVLDWIEGDLEESILSLPQECVSSMFGSKPCIGVSGAQALIENFENDGEYSPRELVEGNLGRVQALPIVIVRNKRGDVLRLRRKEKTDNNLHKRIVIWAGGHVRSEDRDSGSPLIHCAAREIEEELRLCVEPHSLQLRGAIYARVDEGTSKHVALVFEWRARTDEVEVALSNAEFFERMGNSLSGTFIAVDALLREYEGGEIGEEWSGHIVKNFIAETSGKAKRDLFDD
jgi:predicted NUDIX family phosphoesterase